MPAWVSVVLDACAHDPAAPTTRIEFEPDIAQALVHANLQADLEEAPTITSRHLLSAILEVSTPMIDGAMQRAGIQPWAIHPPPVVDPETAAGAAPLRSIIERAMVLARDRSHEQVTLAHLLLALLNDAIGQPVGDDRAVALVRLRQEVTKSIEALPPRGEGRQSE